MHPYKEVVLRPGKEESVKRFHPWIFSGAIATLPEPIIEGDRVRLVASDRSFLGVGHYQPGSIAVRIMSFEIFSSMLPTTAAHPAAYAARSPQFNS